MRTEVTEEEIAVAVASVRSHNNNLTKAAAELEIPREVVQDRLLLASRRGLFGTDAVMPGFGIKQVSKKEGDAWIKQTPVGEQFEVPADHLIKGVSAYVDQSGNLIGKWIKTREDTSLYDVRQALVDVFKEYEGCAQLIDAPKRAGLDPDRATVYVLSDHHLGLYSWAEENGEDYDLDIGERLLMESMGKLVAKSDPTETAVILNLGDFFHSQGNENRTPKSGNVLDVDTRYAKVLRVGVSLMIRCTDLALQKHKEVLVRCLPGNHDPYAALALSVALAAFYNNNPRVTIDTDPSAFFWWRFGKVFIGSTHGDMIKHTEMPGVMAARRPKDWGNSEYRYIYLGHVHHKSVGGGEHAGVIWETFQILAPRDAWHQQSGYSAGRSMVAITHHKEHGEEFRHTVSVKGPG